MTEQPFHSVLRQPAEAAAADTGGLLERVSADQAARIILVALLAGLVGQLLFVGQRSGINLSLWVALALGGALALRRPDARLDRLDAWLPPAALAFAAFVALRDDGMLLMLNLLAAGALTLASVVAIGGVRVSRRSSGALLGLGTMAVVTAAFGATMLAHGVRPVSARLAGRGSPTTRALARGALIALPLLLVFVVLFSAADAVFGAQLRFLLSPGIDARDVTARALAAAVLGWLFAGTMAAAWLAHGPQAEPTAPVEPAAPAAPAAPAQAAARPTWRLGLIEALVVLVALDATFAVFVAIQAAYLFGGLDTLALSGLTYAEYARRGFFELLAAAVLVGLVLIVLGRLVERRTRAYRVAAIVLAGLTAAVLVSAAYRMGLYQGAYGWTELRFFVLAAIGWLGVCLVAGMVGLALDRLRWLPAVVLGSALLVAGAVNVVGPLGFVAERNLERAIDPSLVAPGGETGLDTYYLRWLGAEVVPAMVPARDRLPPALASEVDGILREHARALRDESRFGGWPSWNYARHRALEVLADAGY